MQYETDDSGQRKPDLSTVIPLVDGGTEGFSGHVRTIVPGFSGCFECTLDLFPPQQAVPLCTIAETPRNAAHCILYAHLIEYPKEFPEEKPDKVHTPPSAMSTRPPIPCRAQCRCRTAPSLPLMHVRTLGLSPG